MGVGITTPYLGIILGYGIGQSWKQVHLPYYNYHRKFAGEPKQPSKFKIY